MTDPKTSPDLLTVYLVVRNRDGLVMAAHDDESDAQRDVRERFRANTTLCHVEGWVVQRAALGEPHE